MNFAHRYAQSSAKNCETLTRSVQRQVRRVIVIIQQLPERMIR